MLGRWDQSTRVGGCLHRRVRGRIAAHARDDRPRGACCALACPRGSRACSSRPVAALELARERSTTCSTAWARSRLTAATVHGARASLAKRAGCDAGASVVREIGLHGATDAARAVRRRARHRVTISAMRSPRGLGPRVPVVARRDRARSLRGSSKPPRTSWHRRGTRPSRRTSASTEASGCWPPVRIAEAEVELEQALAFYRSVDATVRTSRRSRARSPALRASRRR